MYVCMIVTLAWFWYSTSLHYMDYTPCKGTSSKIISFFIDHIYRRLLDATCNARMLYISPFINSPWIFILAWIFLTLVIKEFMAEITSKRGIAWRLDRRYAFLDYKYQCYPTTKSINMRRPQMYIPETKEMGINMP